MISVKRFMIPYRPGGAAVEGQPDLWTAGLFAPPDQHRSMLANKSGCRGWGKQDLKSRGKGFLSLAATQSKQLARLNTSRYTGPTTVFSCSACGWHLYGFSMSQWTATKTFSYPGACIMGAPAVLQVLHSYSSALAVGWESQRGLHMAGWQIWLKVYCKNRGIPFVDTFTAFLNSPQLFNLDPSHRSLVPFIDKYWTDTPVRLLLLLVVDSKLRITLDTASQLKLKKLSCMICW